MIRSLLKVGVASDGFALQPAKMTNRLRDQPTQCVTEALEAVYRAFEAPRPSGIEGCPCCISTRSTDILLITPLRQITGQALWRYVSGAFLTIGGEGDFRYLLPRILEISVFDPGNANDPEIVLGKLSLARWRTWAADEQHTIEAFIDGWFEQALARDLADVHKGWLGSDTEAVLCGAARAGLPLERWLVRLAEPDGVPVLADMKVRFPSEPSGFWKDAPEIFNEVRTFMDEWRI